MADLSRAQFWHLYVNANSLSELAILRLADDIEAEPQAQPPPTADEIEVRLAEQFKHMDVAALDGLNWDFFGAGPDAARPEGTPVPRESEFALVSSEGPAGEGGVDLDLYLDRAYAYEAALSAQVDLAYAQVDAAALAALLERLPASGASLTTRLPGVEMGRWLDRYRAGDAALSQLVTKIRALSIRAGSGP